MAGIFSLRNWVMKQLMKQDKSGIMRIPDKGKIDFGEMLVRESLFKKGINPGAVKNEKQLDNILNTPAVPKSERVKPKKSGKVIEVDFDKGRWNKAGGGRTGLSYLLAEDTNERMPFKMGRRAFLKLMGGVGAGIGALKTGALKLFGKEGATVAKELTQVPIKNIEGMPSWFKPLVNKVIKEGEEISGDLERVITHKTKLPESKTDVYVTQDLNTGDVVVDIGMGKHGWTDGYYGQPARLEYKASEVIPLHSPDGSYSKVKHGNKTHTKTPEEFTVEEAEFTGGHPENVKFEDSSIQKYGEHGSDFSEVERFATGKNTVKSQFGKYEEVDQLPKTKKADQLEWAQGKAEADAERWADEIDPDDFASGGIARLGYQGGKLVKGAAWVIKNLKKQLSQFEKEDFMGKLVNINSMEKNAFKNEINTLIKQLEEGRAIPHQMLETMRKDKRFKDVIKTEKIKEQITDSDLIELEEVLLDYGKNVEQKETLKQFDVTGLKKHASGGVAKMLGE